MSRGQSTQRATPTTSPSPLLIAFVALVAPALRAAPEEVESSAAAGRPHWSFRPIVRPELPEVADGAWVRAPVDAFVLARLEEEGLSPSPEADRRRLVRRLSFDLTGLPPSPDEVRAFVADDRPDAWERLVDRLLASPRYGERWARHWLDVVRFAETHGFETNLPRKNAWPYRDWVIRALNADLPYDRFVLLQIAGDAFGADPATGFLVGGPHDVVKSPDVELTRNQRANELHDMVSTTASAFLGLTAGCARCHDHKFDPIPQRDYYRLSAVFAGVRHGEREWRQPGAGAEERERRTAALQGEVFSVEARLASLAPPARTARTATATPEGRRAAVETPPRAPVSARLNVERFEPVEARFVRLRVLATNRLEPCIDELAVFEAGDEARNLALASRGARARSSSDFPPSDRHKLEHVNDGRFGNGRSWISGESGGGWVEIELPERAVIDRVAWARDREGKYADRLATSYRIEVAVEDGEGNADRWRAVATSEDRRPLTAPERAAAKEPPAKDGPASDDPSDERARLLARHAELVAELRAVAAAPQVYAGTFTEPPSTHVLFRGDPMQELDEVRPGAIRSIGRPLRLEKGAPEQERRLALGRWITHPSNPLAARVIANRLWHYHFGAGIVATPSDLGRNGARPTHPALLDWLAAELVASGWSLKRLHRAIVLSATYRQSSAPRADALAVDGDTRLLWRFPPRRLEAEAIRDSILWASGALQRTMGGPGFDVFEANANYVHVFVPKRDFGPAEWRRMVYQWKPRMEQDETFGVFDCPDGAQVAPRRTSSTTPLQALNLLNSPFVIEQAEILAGRLRREAAGDIEDRVRRAFRLLLGRAPAEEELLAAARLVEDHGLAALGRALYNTSEFIRVE